MQITTNTILCSVGVDLNPSPMHFSDPPLPEKFITLLSPTPLPTSYIHHTPKALRKSHAEEVVIESLAGCLAPVSVLVQFKNTHPHTPKA